MPSLLAHQRRTARILIGRGGFTLVELLVVIGIIAILAGVALGPITNGIKKAQESSAVQEAHALGLAMYSFANDNSQTYPDTSIPAGNTGTGAMAAVIPLLTGGYVTDPSIFYISGSAATKYTGAASSAAGSMTSTNISWDFCGNGGPGLQSTSYQYMPILWTSVAGTGGTEPSFTSAGTAGTAVTCAPGASDAFGTAGIAAFYINNSAAFLTASGTTPTVTIISSASNIGGSPSGAAPLKGGG